MIDRSNWRAYAFLIGFVVIFGTYMVSIVTIPVVLMCGR